MPITSTQKINEQSDPSLRHPSYSMANTNWQKIRDCIQGEEQVKSKETTYLPRPAGMSGDYESAYDDYIERAHFPLICAYSLQGALGIVITKMPEFNVPKEMEYIITTATKDGLSLQQFFLNTIVEILSTGRCPILVDILDEKNEFRFVQYNAENLINWKTEVVNSEQNLILAVLEEAYPENDDIFSHDTIDVQRVLVINEEGNYESRLYGPEGEYEEFKVEPKFMGESIKEVPLFIAGSINNSYEIQPIPLLSVANCSIQIYRKEADLANSEFLSCNPTLVFSGVSNDDDLPNVVGSSVLITLPDSQARAYYTTTDTAALSHVSKHVEALYDEAIRHGVSILDARKGVEAAEALRIRQATQSASIYSIYLSALDAIQQGLELMADWGGHNKEDIVIDAPSSLTYGIPDAQVIAQIVEGFGAGVVPISVVHRYMIQNGMIDQTISLEEYIEELKEQEIVPITEKDIDSSSTSSEGSKKPAKKTNSESGGTKQ
jgi:hypothetical protein